MIRLTRTLDAWGKPDFNAVFKHDIEQLDPSALPLQHTVFNGGAGISAVVIGAADDSDLIRAKAGVFYAAMQGFSHCEDDAGPVDEQNEYCELQFDIDKKTAETAITRIGERADVGCE
jgi:hypothetical protein